MSETVCVLCAYSTYVCRPVKTAADLVKQKEILSSLRLINKIRSKNSALYLSGFFIIDSE